MNHFCVFYAMAKMIHKVQILFIAINIMLCYNKGIEKKLTKAKYF